MHWHLGAEHKNTGTYDQAPPAKFDANTGRRLASTNQAGFWCPAPTDGSINMADDYEWKYCSKMHVGETYEIHWPHSNFGMCPTIDEAHPKWQYQSHFMDGAPGGLTADPLRHAWLTSQTRQTPPPLSPLPSPTPPARPRGRRALQR